MMKVFRRDAPLPNQTPSHEDDRAAAMRDHQAFHAGKVVGDARDEMIARNQNAWRTPVAKSTVTPTNASHIDENESPLDKARREMNERHQNAWKSRV